MRHHLSQPLPSDVQAALGRNDKLEAMRLLRAQTALGLAQAKESVEDGHIVGLSTSASVAPVTDLPAKAVAALAAGNRIEAIKRLREATGMGLKEAMELVDRHDGRTRVRLPGPALGEVPASNAARWIAFLAVVVVLIAWLVLCQR